MTDALYNPHWSFLWTSGKVWQITTHYVWKDLVWTASLLDNTLPSRFKYQVGLNTINNLIMIMVMIGRPHFVSIHFVNYCTRIYFSNNCQKRPFNSSINSIYCLPCTVNKSWTMIIPYIISVFEEIPAISQL